MSETPTVPGGDETPSAYEPFPSFPEWRGPMADTATFDRYVALLEQTRASASPQARSLGVETATRVAAVDTGAIEGLYQTDRGFTQTIALQAAAWEVALDNREPVVRKSIDDALAAFEYVLDAATKTTPISESWIRQLHEIACRSQETYHVHTQQGPQDLPLPKGAYKTEPNSPVNVSTGRVHHYASPLDTPAEMTRLVHELRTSAFEHAHPVVQATYAHYAFVCVHPFADGNGRVARLLASVYLYRTPGIPLVVFADQRNSYLDALEAADAGHHQLFTEFIGARVTDAIQLVREYTTGSGLPPVGRSVQDLTASLTGRFGVTYPEMDAAASRLLDQVGNEVDRRLSGVALPPNVTSQVTTVTAGSRGVPDGYRSVPGGRYLQYQITSQPPGGATEISSIDVFIARPETIGPTFVVRDDRGQDQFEVELGDVVPTVTEMLRLRIAAWVERQLEVDLESLRQKVVTALEKSGYA